jgi:hypothetical protein
MGKGKSGREKQDAIYAQFLSIIRNEKYASPTLTEQIIEETARKKEEFAKRKKPEIIQRSFYNPNNPLNGSTSWSKQQWEEYNEKVKAEKRAAKINSKIA